MNSIKLMIMIINIIGILLLTSVTTVAADYYVSNSGNDANSGLDPEKPWKTIDKVNSFNFSYGDVIHFKCGSVWREQLIPDSGSEKGDITYTSYGTGNKPLLLGTVKKNAPSDWTNEGKNIWSTNKSKTINYELLPNSSFNTGKTSWTGYFNSASRATGMITRDTLNYDSSPAGLRVKCNIQGKSISDIQVFTANINIKKNKTYVLTFRAKASKTFKIFDIALIKNISPWSSYTWFKSNTTPTITTHWKTYEMKYISNITAEDARIDFFLGDVMPVGSTLYLDSLSLKEIADSAINSDVRSITFNNGEACGIKVWNKSDLDEQNEFWYDPDIRTLKVNSKQNPALLYNDIECVLKRYNIDQTKKSHITYDGLKLLYGGNYGIGGANTNHITVRNCDIIPIGRSSDYVKSAKPIVGTIRWDQFLGRNNGVGAQVEKTLSPNKYHFRLPFFASVTGENSVSIPAYTQDVIDQEIEYAKDAGIDYWAFVWYPPSSAMNLARNLYLSSQHKNDVKWCEVVINDDSFRMKRDLPWLINQFKLSNYQKVLDNRPLVYLFSVNNKTKELIKQLRLKCSEKGIASPYIVIMGGTSAANVDGDAVSEYAIGAWNGISFQELARNAENRWDTLKQSNPQVIPLVTTGWDPRPRIDNPVSWTNYPQKNWAHTATSQEIATHLKNAINWVQENKTVDPANTVLIYAWNENDEGGWIAPTLFEIQNMGRPERLDAIKAILNPDMSR